MTTMMACGHAANSKTPSGAPSCAICVGIHPGADTVAKAPDLTGRIARCAYYGQRARISGRCQSEAPSSTDLAFFEHRPDEPHDRFYCGCWGWD